MIAMAKRSTRSVLSIGEMLIDFIATDRGATLETAELFAARAGGAPANVSVALARLGVASAFCGVVGLDPFGTRLERALTAEGVDTSRLRQSTHAATALAFAWKDERGDGYFWLLRGADVSLSPTDVDSACIEECSALVLGSVSLAAHPAREATLHAAKSAHNLGVPVVFDINLRPTVWEDPGEALTLCEQVAHLSQIVKLSLDDARGLFGASVSPERAIARLLRLGPMAVVLTDGERGCWLATTHQTEPEHLPAFTIEAIEPTGAGDAFCAALVDRMLQSQWSQVTISDVRYAAAAGALATTKHGAWAGLPTRQQLDEFAARSIAGTCEK
jgi:fructokinase